MTATTETNQPAINGDISNTRTGAQIELTPEGARLPVDRYIDPAFLAAEIKKLWLRVWQVACREIDVPNAGDYHEYKVGAQSYLVLRGNDGVVRAFHNVCPHRANLLREGCGNTGGELTCPFHRLRFTLEGKLSLLTDPDSWRHLQDGELDLRPVSAECWGGWVFVNPDPEPDESLREFLGPVYDQLAPYHLDLTVPVGMNLTTKISANWKISVEAFLENYHVQGIHPQILAMMDDVNTGYETLGKHSRMISKFALASPHLGEDVDPMEILEAFFGGGEEPKPAPGEAYGDVADPNATNEGAATGEYMMGTDTDPMAVFRPYLDDKGQLNLPEGETVRSMLKTMLRAAAEAKGVDFSGLSDDQMIDDWHYYIFPNIVLNILPSAMLYFRFLPDWHDPNQTTWDIQALEWIPDREKAKAAKAPHVEFGEKEQSLGLILDQDVYQMPRIQRGLRSGALEHITLCSQELRLLHLNTVVDSYLAHD